MSDTLRSVRNLTHVSYLNSCLSQATPELGQTSPKAAL